MTTFNRVVLVEWVSGDNGYPVVHEVNLLLSNLGEDVFRLWWGFDNRRISHAMTLANDVPMKCVLIYTNIRIWLIYKIILDSERILDFILRNSSFNTIVSKSPKYSD